MASRCQFLLALDMNRCQSENIKQASVLEKFLAPSCNFQQGFCIVGELQDPAAEGPLICVFVVFTYAVLVYIFHSLPQP